MKSLKRLVVLLVLNSSYAFAFPQAPVDDINFRPEIIEQFGFFAEYNFEGIVKLSNCSGSLIKFEGQKNYAKAIVMTNGHCVKRDFFGGLLQPGEVISNRKIRREMKIFKDGQTLYPITSQRLLYATMTDTDLALYELTESYQEIYNRTDISPLILSNSRPHEGEPIEIISGYWERGYSCGIDEFVYQLKENNWKFSDAIRYTPGCDTIGGTSGSPIIAAGTREVIAINNTANESGKRCALNNPCEVNEDGEVFVKKGLKYGTQTYQIYACLDANHEFALKKPSCQLPE